MDLAQARRIAEAVTRNRRPGASSSLVERAEAAKRGDLTSVPMCSKILTHLAKPCLKGQVVIVSGAASVSKSFFITQNMIDWHRGGIPFAGWFFEDSQSVYLARMLAQLDGDANLKDSDWIMEHPAEWDEAYNRHRDTLDCIADSIEADSGKSYNYGEALLWVRERVEQGCRIVVLDPVTALDKEGPGMSGESWNADKQFVRELGRIVAGKATAIIVTHPSADGTRMAGGEGFIRFAHTVIELSANYDEKKVWVLDVFGGRVEVTPNRMARIAKAREGTGTGKVVALDFARKLNPHDPTELVRLVFTDVGIVCPKPKNSRIGGDDE